MKYWILGSVFVFLIIIVMVVAYFMKNMKDKDTQEVDTDTEPKKKGKPEPTDNGGSAIDKARDEALKKYRKYKKLSKECASNKLSKLLFYSCKKNLGYSQIELIRKVNEYKRLAGV